MEKWEGHEGNERRVREKKDTGVRGFALQSVDRNKRYPWKLNKLMLVQMCT
jgi:hypothetical protein